MICSSRPSALKMLRQDSTGLRMTTANHEFKQHARFRWNCQHPALFTGCKGADAKAHLSRGVLFPSGRSFRARARASLAYN
jgi:hypothetical protein